MTKATPSPDDARSLSSSKRSYPLIRAVVAQIAAAVIVIGGQQILGNRADLVLPLPLLLAFQGVIAAGLGHLLGLARWWLPINLLLPAAAALALLLNLPAWIYPLLFLALALVFWNSADDRVPLYLTNRKTWQALEALLGAEAQRSKEPLKVSDIGCGLGGALLYLARRYPQAEFVGIESAPLPYALARLRALVSGAPNLEIRYGDLWKQDLSVFDLVYCFLSPEPMPRLFEKAKREMGSGTLLISNSFEVPGVTADEVVTVQDSRETELLVYRL
ncbi:class I SAM-dependent methyltransferase [Denitrobaculum tricleocarpae]|uniref:Class I SAM-dependent methyltransferase n=1 Tax=Denitrobaculum tricleocarpae TaxID=2591009 RepID=A0A545TTN9_9PROT|nr:class I SAM-dependent methyltransferase [Denitrobaculum tricleocarpae]TQV80589.1 class I SAM-dependent methyltransferase [Denitrobaculum tricleocarpae]